MSFLGLDFETSARLANIAVIVLAALGVAVGAYAYRWSNEAQAIKDAAFESFQQEARTKLANLEIEASNARERAAIAEKELLEIKEKTKDRELDGATRSNLIDWLKGGAKSTIRMWAPNAPEPVAYARHLRAAVEEAGWTVSALTVAPQLGSPSVGLKIWFDSDEPPPAAQELLNALNSAGLSAQPVRTANARNGEIVLAVGFK
jgi:hypothetical protein